MTRNQSPQPQQSFNADASIWEEMGKLHFRLSQQQMEIGRAHRIILSKDAEIDQLKKKVASLQESIIGEAYSENHDET